MNSDNQRKYIHYIDEQARTPRHHRQTSPGYPLCHAGSKIYYQLSQGGENQWADYETLTHMLPAIIQFEKQRQCRKTGLPADQEEEEGRMEQLIGKQISNLVFMEERDGALWFRVTFLDGEVGIHSNRQLRQTHPSVMLDFYESNLMISFE